MRTFPRTLALLATACTFALSVTSAEAGNGNRGGGCPPGLAKKSPACVPPGLAKKQYAPATDDYPYRIGDRITGDFILIERPGRYGLDPGQSYYRFGDSVFRVNRETREILDFIGAATALLN